MAVQYSWRGKRVLVVGGTGKVGAALIPELLALGASSVIVTGKKTEGEVRQDPRLKLPDAASYAQIVLPDAVTHLPVDVDVVLVLAAIPTAKLADSSPREAFRLNVETVRAILDHYSASDSAAPIVVASSVRTSELRSMYEWTKIAAEGIVTSSEARPGSKRTVVRLGNVSGNVISLLVQDLISGTTNIKKIQSNWEYFQSRGSLPYTFAAALCDEVSHGSIVTPILSPVPIPFMVGCLVGYFAASRKRDVVQFERPYDEHIPNPSPPIPEWWYRSSKQIEFDVPGLQFVVTNFKEVQPSGSATEELTSRLRQQRTATFGEFIRFLDEAGVLGTIDRAI